MNKNRLLILSLSALIAITVLTEKSTAQTPPSAPPAKKAAPAANAAASKKRIKLDYENDVVMGVYETPDASFINSRRMIKYKELFNRRTNFIEEIDSNKGLFNEYQK